MLGKINRELGTTIVLTEHRLEEAFPLATTVAVMDGGRLLFLLIEAVRGKPVNPKYEGYVHALGFVLLFGLMIVVTFNDIVRLFRG